VFPFLVLDAAEGSRPASEVRARARAVRPRPGARHGTGDGGRGTGDGAMFIPTRTVGLEALDDVVARAGSACTRERNHDHGPSLSFVDVYFQPKG